MHIELNAGKLAGIAGGFAAGAAVFALCNGTELGHQGALCLGILCWAIVWWIAGVLPEYATGLLMVAAFSVIAGIDTSVSLAAFSTSTWWLLVAAFALGAGMKTSGLMRRMALGIVRRLPQTFSAQVAGIMAAGTLLGPLVPSMAAKASMLGPISMGIGDALGYPRKGRQMQGLFLAMITGVRNAGPAFISASVVGYALWGLLPQQTQQQFDMLHWLLAALPWLAVVTALNLVAIIAIYRPRQGECGRKGKSAESNASGCMANSGAPTDNTVGGSADDAVAGDTSAGAIRNASSAPTAPSPAAASAPNPAATPQGPMSSAEKRMLAIIIATIALWATQPLHGVPSHVVGLAAVAVMVAFGLLPKASLKNDIAWDSLIFIGCVIGLANVFSAAGIDSWIVTSAGPLFQQLAANPYAFVLGVGLSTILLRFVIVSEMAYINIVMAFLIPLAGSLGMSPWVVGFAVYATVHPWFALYQNPVYLAAFYSVDGQMASHGSLARYCVLYMATCLVGLAVSVPYWQLLGFFG